MYVGGNYNIHFKDFVESRSITDEVSEGHPNRYLTIIGRRALTGRVVGAIPSVSK